MTTITIPPEALEKAAISLHYGGWGEADEAEKEAYRETARAAALALLENWPGMEAGLFAKGERDNVLAIILPLPEGPKP